VGRILAGQLDLCSDSFAVLPPQFVSRLRQVPVIIDDAATTQFIYPVW
jgi:hypothetical protein